MIIKDWQKKQRSKRKKEPVRISVRYYLCNLNSFESGTVGCLHITNADAIVIEPLIDMRHMYDDSAPEACGRLNDGMIVSISAMRVIADEKGYDNDGGGDGGRRDRRDEHAHVADVRHGIVRMVV